MSTDVPKKRKFSRKDWKTAAEFIYQEKERRARSPKRRDKERMWAEVDRQIAMTPRKRDAKSGTADDWVPDLELPMQATALEVLSADTRRLKFPRTAEWFTPHSELSDTYMQRFQDRRERFPIIGDQPVGMKLDQETSDTLVKATMDHYHRLYRFREQFELMDAEALKYGTYAARVVQGLIPKFSNDYRGVKKEMTLGPQVVPVSVKNLFLDDSPQFVMQEGMTLSPSYIRNYYQKLDDTMRAAKTGGVDRGWILPNLRRLEPLGDKDDKRGHIELLEFEGDLVISRSQGKIFLPNIIVTVAVGGNGPEVVRYREQKLPFRSYVTGVYQKDDMDSPYGTSPLMKGQPIQEAAVDVLNRTIAAAALNANPPVGWDRTDSGLQATGGPEIFPGAMWGSESPGDIKVHDIGSPEALFNIYMGLMQQYEDLTGVTAPRRGAQTKSHTTAFAVDVENVRGLVRTEDFVVSQELGPLTSILYMEYEIIKRSMNSATSIFVGGGGFEGFVNLHKDDLPDNVVFNVQGSAGPVSRREKMQNVVMAFQTAAQMAPLSAQLGGPIPNFAEGFKEIFQNADVANPDRFITSPTGLPGQTDGVGGVPGAGGALPGEEPQAG